MPGWAECADPKEWRKAVGVRGLYALLNGMLVVYVGKAEHRVASLQDFSPGFLFIVRHIHVCFLSALTTIVRLRVTQRQRGGAVSAYRLIRNRARVLCFRRLWLVPSGT